MNPTLFKPSVEDIAEKWAAILARDGDVLTRSGIGTGLAGLSLYFLNDYKARGSKKSLQNFLRFFESAVNNVNQAEYHPLWIADLTELGYLLSQGSTELKQHFDIRTLRETIEECLFETALKMMDAQNFDPFSGAFYPAYYFKQVQAHPRFLKPFIDLLYESFVQTDKGLFFDSRFRENEKCLSTTHGLAFYILFLCELGPGYFPLKNNHHLVKGFVSFILNHQRNFNRTGCFFPDYIGDSQKTRLSLGYGDAGILLALLKAAYWLHDAALLEKVKGMLLHTCARRQISETRIQSTNLLYGSSGMLLYYAHLQSLLHMESLSETARFWEQQLIKEVMGMKWEYYQSGEYLNRQDTNQLTFSEGITGALACLNAVRSDTLTDLLFPFYLI